MIQIGNTIVFKNENGYLGFFWLCDIRPDGYVFFDWYGNPRKVTHTDFWKMSVDWFNARLAEGIIEVYDSLPEKYMDIFEKQAIERNNE